MGSVWPATWPPAAEELHIFDPKGDVLLVLLRHSIDSMMDELDSEDEMSIVTNGDVEGENVEENGEEKKLDLQGLKKDLELDCVSGVSNPERSGSAHSTAISCHQANHLS